MTNWQIGESGTGVTIDAQGRGEFTNTVTNAGPQQDRAVLTITPLDGAAAGWFVVEEPQRAVPPGESVVYRVVVTVAPGTAPGDYACQPVVYSADSDPSESSATGLRQLIKVPETAPPPPGFPKWAFLVIAAVVLIVAGVLWKVLSGGGGLEATERPEATGTAEVGQTLATTNGEWSKQEDDDVFTVQWERCNADGDDCAAIDGATLPTFPVGADDVGSTLRSMVTATVGDESATESSAPTDVVPEPPAQPPVPVPDLVGDTRSQALAKLSGNFVAVVVTAGPSSGVCNPVVESQNPSDGTLLEVGATVTIATRPPLPILQCIQFPIFDDGFIIVDEPLQQFDDDFFDQFEDLEEGQSTP